MLKRAWKTAASIQTTFWLLGLTTLLFVIGSIHLHLEKQILPQLNFFMIQDWLQRQGVANLRLSWWLFVLLFLLFLLGVNTVVCSIDRLLKLLPLYKKAAKIEFTVTVTPTLIHLIFIFVLCGHLLSSFAGSVETVSCAPGQTVTFAGGRSLRVLAVHYETYSRPAALEGKLKEMSADLRVHVPGCDGAFTTAILSPAHRAGYSFHLDSIDKYARTRQLRLIIRRDPGIRVIIPGLITIILLMAGYFPALTALKKQSFIKEK